MAVSSDCIDKQRSAGHNAGYGASTNAIGKSTQSDLHITTVCVGACAYQDAIEHVARFKDILRLDSERVITCVPNPPELPQLQPHPRRYWKLDESCTTTRAAVWIC